MIRDWLIRWLGGVPAWRVELMEARLQVLENARVDAMRRDALANIPPGHAPGEGAGLATQQSWRQDPTGRWHRMQNMTQEEMLRLIPQGYRGRPEGM